MELAPFQAPAGHSTARFYGGRARLSYSRPKPAPAGAPLGHDTRDLLMDAYTNHPGHAATVAKILAVFAEAEAGFPQQQCDLFDDFILPDGHLASLFEKRDQAVCGKPKTIASGEPGNKESDLAAKVLRVALGRLPMDTVYQHLLGSANRYGWGASEIDWGLMSIDGRQWIVPVWLTNVRSRRFRIARPTGLDASGTGDLRLFTDPKNQRGEELRAGKWIVLKRDPSVPLACAGLMRGCAFSAFGKRYGFRDWMAYAEKYGKPFPIASYQANTDDGSKEVATEIIQNIGNDVGAAVPNTVGLEFKEARSADNSKTHGGLIEQCERDMSKRVNGSTLSTDNNDSGGASYAMANVHDSVRWEAVEYDASRLRSEVGLQLFAMFCHFNGISAPPPTLEIQIARELSPQILVEVASKYCNDLGGPVSRSQMSQLLGLREPTNALDKLPGMPKPDPAPPGGMP